MPGAEGLRSNTELLSRLVQVAITSEELCAKIDGALSLFGNPK